MANGISYAPIASISGQPVSISGQPVSVTVTATADISGQTIHVASGNINVLSGKIEVTSGIFIASGIHVVTGAATADISGDAVWVASGDINLTTPSSIVTGSVVKINHSGTQLPNKTVKSVTIRNQGIQTVSGGEIWIGGNTVTSGTGIQIEKKETVNLDIDNTNKLYAWAATSGNELSYLGTN